MPPFRLVTVRQNLAWSYGNLAMAVMAHDRGDSKYSTPHYMVRSKLYNGLNKETLKMGSFFKDEKLKMEMPKACCYCGTTEKLSLDHLVPRYHAGADTADNLVWACRHCNSSKRASDLLDWLAQVSRRPSLYLYRRYVKLATCHCTELGMMEMTPEEALSAGCPFRLDLLIMWFPDPLTWTLWVLPESPAP